MNEDRAEMVKHDAAEGEIFVTQERMMLLSGYMSMIRSFSMHSLAVFHFQDLI